MGMTASQARYLALTARKTNTEYEGQQINQARTALANQSANLFNRLLGLEVPVAPKTTDYTELQYSYSDGENESVLESWEQLSTADPNYNYIVNHYYYANLYTGCEKLLEDPQVTQKGQTNRENIQNKYGATAVANIAPDKVEILASNQPGAPVLETYNNVNSINSDKEFENAIKDFENFLGFSINRADLYAVQDSDGTWHFVYSGDGYTEDYSTTYNPVYVGNSPLTHLSNPLTKEQVAELAQIIKDCPESNMTNYLSFDNQGNLVYNGSGIYSFDLHGKTYFTNRMDLLDSAQTNEVYDKPIDNQKRMPYYHSTYVKTRIEESNKALLETDENGRFKSVRFDNNSIVYALNTETVTDEAAYQDAMNEYNYKVQIYEKTIADINAKTSIIQEEDRTLELRLKQLDTEQNALATEMDAVKKVIKDNVEKTFKTFSD